MLTAAGLEALAVDDIRSAEWSKLTMAAPVQAVAALTRSRFHETLATPELARVVARLTRECTDVAQAAGIELRDWPSLSPVATLAALSFDDLVAALEAQGRDLGERGLTDIRPSMLQSVERGRGLEVDALQGFVVREARRHGVAVPATDVCRELLAGMNRRLTTHAPEEVAGAR
jgi:2-dehydropantoate 2-reductase